MRRAFIFLAVIGLAGCKKDSVSTENTPAAGAPQAARDADAVIKVLEPGKEPRRALRRSPAPRQKERLEMRVDNELDASLAMLQARQAPRSVMFELTVQADEAVHDGAQVFAFTVDEARVVGTAALPPKIRKTRQEATATLRGLEGSYVVDAHGQVQEIVMNLPSDASREVWSIAGDLTWALRQLASSFPEEPIGAGATWTIDRGIEQDGVRANEVSKCEITMLQGQLVTVKTDLRQSASPQTFRAPGSSMDVELTEFDAQGAGRLTWDLTRLLPRSAQLTLTETKHIRYTADGQPATATAVKRRSLAIPQ